MLIKYVFILFFTFVILGQEIPTIDKAIHRDMDKSWMLLQSSGVFHSADIADGLGFEIKASEQRVSFESSFNFDGTQVNDFTMRTLSAAIEIPIDLQVGLTLTLPTYTLYDYKTELTGYFLKFQFNDLIWDMLPEMALFASYRDLKLGTFYTHTNATSSLILSEKFSFFEPFIAYTAAHVRSTLKTDDYSLDGMRLETFPTAGVSLNSTFITLTAESIFFESYTHVSFSAALKF
jgi:hypothetical protein